MAIMMQVMVTMAMDRIGAPSDTAASSAALEWPHRDVCDAQTDGGHLADQYGLEQLPQACSFDTESIESELQVWHRDSESNARFILARLVYSFRELAASIPSRSFSKKFTGS